MPDNPPKHQRFFAELKRRRVFRVMASYGAAAFAGLQVADILVPVLELPESVTKVVALVLLIGFPVAVVLEWAFEMGPEGVREYAAIYHGMVKYIDDEVGRVLKKLDELGLADNTLVIFTTDHGDMVGAHGCIGKSIFSFYDDLVRIPLLMRLPGRIPPGTRTGQIAASSGTTRATMACWMTVG